MLSVFGDMSGVNFSLIYTGTSSGEWRPGAGEKLYFTSAGVWTFYVTLPATLGLKGCGPGGFGGYSTTFGHVMGTGGGGGAYHLGTTYEFLPGVGYRLTLGAGGSGTATLLEIQGIADILHLGAGTNGVTGFNGTGAVVSPGGTSSTGGGTTGGVGGIYLGAGPTSTSGTGGGGAGGAGNYGGTGGFYGQNGGNGETAGAVGEAPGGYDGGDGGVGGGVTINGVSTYGRGAGGQGQEGTFAAFHPAVYVFAAGAGALQFTR